MSLNKRFSILMRNNDRWYIVDNRIVTEFFCTSFQQAKQICDKLEEITNKSTSSQSDHLRFSFITENQFRHWLLDNGEKYAFVTRIEFAKGISYFLNLTNKGFKNINLVQ